MARFLKLYALEMSLVWLAFGFYCLVPFDELAYSSEKGLHFGDGNTVETLFWLACGYSAAAVYLIARKVRRGEQTKLAFVLDKIRTRDFDFSLKTALLFYLAQFLFIPVVVPTAVLYATYIWDALSSFAWQYTSAVDFFNGFFFPLLINVFILIGSSYSSFGYLVESDRLGNKVKSVDRTLSGWAVTVVCYLPFFVIAKQIVYFPARDLAYVVNDEITTVIRIVILLLIAFKAWSWVELGAKNTLMTNRGIVTSGPFKWIRHPHYSVKLIVWWMTLYPAFSKSSWALAAMGFWTVVYVLRALTEERHLRADPDYVEYCHRVRWRFIPHVY